MNTHKITRAMVVGALSLGTVTAGAATATTATAADDGRPTAKTSAFTTEDGKVSCGWDKRSRLVTCFNSTKGWGGDKIVTTFGSANLPDTPFAPTQGPDFDSPRQQPDYNDNMLVKHVEISTPDKGDYVDQGFLEASEGTNVVFPNGQKMTVDRDGVHGPGTNGHPWAITSHYVKK